MTRGRDTWTYAGVCTRSAHARFGWGWSAVPYPSGVEYDFLEVSLPSQLNSGFKLVDCEEFVVLAGAQAVSEEWESSQLA